MGMLDAHDAHDAHDIWWLRRCERFTRHQNQYDQAPRLQCRRQKCLVSYALNAALSRNLVDVAVALAAVLGPRTAEMSGTRSLTIHGPKALMPAKVVSGENECCGVECVDMV